ncbi:MAG: hypothetical protein H6Q60_3 [Oscillospiraceae bacterium]|nr:hypothetical protein [Oscillospiraceae bacterium]
MIDTATSALVCYIREKGINIKNLSMHTGIANNILYRVISGARPLRAGEYLAICDFLEKDPNYFKTNMHEIS